MSSIVVDQVPSGAATPGQPGRDSDPFPLLKRNDSLTSTNLGGKFALPVEFDTARFASAFYVEGQEVIAMEADQPIIGSPYTSEGWQVWKYPDERPSGKSDGKGQPVMEKHPNAGKTHKVAGLKQGENYVLMCRSAAVQHQVNHVYGLVSIELMMREQRGETLSIEGFNGDPGMLTDERLKREIGVEREIEEASGRSTAVHAQPPSGRIEKPAQRVSR